MLSSSVAFAAGNEMLIPKITPATLEASYYISSVNLVHTFGYDNTSVSVTTDGINIITNGATRIQWREEGGIWFNHTDPNYGSNSYFPYTYVGIRVYYDGGHKEYEIVR